MDQTESYRFRGAVVTVRTKASTLLLCVLASLIQSAVGRAEAPTDAIELADRLAQLRRQYAPYLRSLPDPLPAPPRQDLSGDNWISRYEVADAEDGQALDASDWHQRNAKPDGWSRTTVPEWRYGMKETRHGRSAVLWYRTTFETPDPRQGERVWLCFAGVDWQAEVFLNGQKLGTHLVYHEPFRFDVTRQLTRGANTLAVRVTSGQAFGEPAAHWAVLPVPTLGKDQFEGRYVRDRSRSLAGFLNGDTIVGDGYGIHREVYLETTGPVRLDRIFARWPSDKGGVQVAVEADSLTACEAEFVVDVMPENFVSDGNCGHERRFRVRLTPGKNVIRTSVPLRSPLKWSPEAPHLYRCRVQASGGPSTWDNAKDVLFGAREFRIVTRAESTPERPEGMFLLNSQPCQLRGTSMHGLNVLWYWGEEDRIHDILLYLKAANFNAVRSCQHVCFPEVREWLDRMGVMSQQDQGCRGLKTPDILPNLLAATTALNRETYNNPGVVLLSYANECDFDVTPCVKASVAVDPDRVSVPISGQVFGRDLEPIEGRETNPTLPDALWDQVVCSIHPYWGWYGRRADLPAIAERDYPRTRMQCVGEYGSEAMDHYVTMQRYPDQWDPVPSSATDTLWGHVQVERNDVRQLVGGRGEQSTTLAGHILASQVFQADQLHELTRSWRLMDKQINGYFQFHFIDVLPANWPKSILSHDLEPKAGYYVMAQLNQPLAPMVEIDAGGQTATLWVANSTGTTLEDTTLRWQVLDDSHVQVEGERSFKSIGPGVLRAVQIALDNVPQDQRQATFVLGVFGSDGRLLSKYRYAFYIAAWRK